MYRTTSDTACLIDPNNSITYLRKTSNNSSWEYCCPNALNNANYSVGQEEAYENILVLWDKDGKGESLPDDSMDGGVVIDIVIIMQQPPGEYAAIWENIDGVLQDSWMKVGSKKNKQRFCLLLKILISDKIKKPVIGILQYSGDWFFFVICIFLVFSIEIHILKLNCIFSK